MSEQDHDEDDLEDRTRSVSSRGQLTVPIEYREKFGGDYRVRDGGNKILLIPLEPASE